MIGRLFVHGKAVSHNSKALFSD